MTNKLPVFYPSAKEAHINASKHYPHQAEVDRLLENVEVFIEQACSNGFYETTIAYGNQKEPGYNVYLRILGIKKSALDNPIYTQAWRILRESGYDVFVNKDSEYVTISWAYPPRQLK